MNVYLLKSHYLQNMFEHICICLASTIYCIKNDFFAFQSDIKRAANNALLLKSNHFITCNNDYCDACIHHGLITKNI